MSKEIRNFKDRVTIQALNRIEDEGGGYEENWIDEDTVWAEIIPQNAREEKVDKQKEPIQSDKVRIRYNENMSAAKRFKVITQDNKILSPSSCIDEKGKKRFMLLNCTEVIGGDGTN